MALTMMKFDPGMTVRTLCLLFFFVSYGNGDDEVKGKILSTYDREDKSYCHVCPNHTMCMFPSDCKSEDCIDMEYSDLDREDIETVLDSHNFYRVAIASGKESRGNPGPQPAARTMMELMWDDELAVLARRWALQCKLFERDQCRDIERFGVWQNVNVLNVDNVEYGTSRERIHFHITSWYDEVEDFDNAEIGLVNYSSAWQLSSYIPLASATFIYVGCGRAIYTLDLNKTAATGGFGNRVEVLVCNYGPVDRTAPQQLYKLGRPGLCPSGTFPSDHYQFLCKVVNHQDQDTSFLSKSSRKFQARNRQQIRNRTISIVHAVSLNQLLLLLYLTMQLPLHYR